MGTNYYLKQNVCPHCGLAKSEKHIGKSSAGWCFSLRIYPDQGIHDLQNWKELFAEPHSEIRDEYGDQLSPQEMCDRIENRGRDEQWEKKPYGYESWDDFHMQNYSQKGPKGLLRHVIGRFCAKHGKGTWDCIERDFS